MANRVSKSERKAWAREHFRGIENVLIPSFNADLTELDEEGIRLDVRQSKRHGFFSSLCAVETGLSPEEKNRFVEIACDEARNVAGDGDYGISVSLAGDTLEGDLRLLQAAEAAGATHGLLSFPQAFVPKTQDDIYEYGKALADSTDMGIYLFVSDKFGFGRFHPSGVPFEAFEKLADLPNVVAMKVGGMDAGMITECFDRFSDRLAVTSVNIGMIPLLRKTYDVTWTGAWTAEALQSPEQPHAVNMMKLLLENRNAEAMATYWRMTPALKSMMAIMAPLMPTGAYHWPLLKYQQWLSGGNGGLTRQPAMRVFQHNLQVIRGGLAAVGVQCPDPDEDFFLGRSVLGRQRGETSALSA
ncbi:MAG: dihydrodipicolinate synthase family protein [Sphingomonadaceae bacterium]|nr:dihydrodipicolinate synthase family protein [Sphingomonadaceae bacterium]